MKRILFTGICFFILMPIQQGCVFCETYCNPGKVTLHKTVDEIDHEGKPINVEFEEVQLIRDGKNSSKIQAVTGIFFVIDTGSSIQKYCFSNIPNEMSNASLVFKEARDWPCLDSEDCKALYSGKMELSLVRKDPKNYEFEYSVSIVDEDQEYIETGWLRVSMEDPICSKDCD